MNIFYLSRCPKKAAKLMCDKHVVKMILESAQMLCTAHHINGSMLTKDEIYKPAYVNHPSTKWARESMEQYEWLYKHFCELCKEYTHRYHKTHATEKIINDLYDVCKGNYMKKTEPPQCMPDKYKSKSYVQAYRNYYIGDKKRLAKYTNRKPPEFMQ